MSLGKLLCPFIRSARQRRQTTQTFGYAVALHRQLVNSSTLKKYVPTELLTSGLLCVCVSIASSSFRVITLTKEDHWKKRIKFRPVTVVNLVLKNLMTPPIKISLKEVTMSTFPKLSHFKNKDKNSHNTMWIIATDILFLLGNGCLEKIVELPWWLL